MADRLSELESELHSLRDSVAGLRSRVTSLERALESTSSRDAGRDGPARREAPPVTSTEAPAAGVAGADRAPVATGDEESALRLAARLAGGVLLVIAGGYLLRALTEAGAVPRSLGVAVGLGYALVWSIACHVLARRGQGRSAAANGIATALLGFPLLWEATARFEILSPWSGALLLLGVGTVLLSLARHHGLTSLAWVGVLGLGVASLLSMFGTRTFEPYAVALLAVGLGAAAWGGRHGGMLPWVAYGFSDLGALLLIVGSLGERPVTTPALALPILVATFLGFLGIFAHRTWRSGELAFDEPIQGTVATVFGYGGALLVAAADLPATVPGLGVLGLVLGVAGYVVLSSSVRWAREHRWPYLLYSSLALGTVAMGIVALFPEPGWVFAGLGVVLAVAGVWLDRTSPGLHAAMSLLLAAATSDLFGLAGPTLTGGRDAAALTLPPPALATLLAALVCAALPLKIRSPVWPIWLPRLGRAAVILVAALGIDALVVRGLLPPITAGLEDTAAAAAAAAVRTGALAAVIVALALASHWRPLQPASWLVYPLLAVAGLKLVLVDFPHGRALTMAAALLLYGGALILAPRWNRLRDDRADP